MTIKKHVPKPKVSSKGKKVIKKRKSYFFSSRYYLQSYLLAKQGNSNTKIAHIIGVSYPTFLKWVQEKPALREALREGRKSITADSTKSFLDFTFGRLPKELQELWTEIEACEEAPTSTERLEGLLSKQGVRSQQYLYFHALITCDFSSSQACRKVGISNFTINKWRREPEFAQLLDEFHQHKKDFFEEHLCRLVRTGDSAATIFANKTINRDRGYNEKTDVNVSITNNYISIEELNLTLEVRKAIMVAIKEKEKLQETRRDPLQIPYKGKTVDAEIVENAIGKELANESGEE